MASNQAQRPKRRNAVKHGKVVEIKGHKFVLTYFKQFTFCGHCTRFLWGVTGPQGYRCLSCDFAIHNRCLEYVAFICPGTSLPAGLEPRPHNFKTASFYHPTFCAHCGSMIYGLFNQGVRCSDCGMTAHHRCQALVPRSCGQDTQEKRGRIKLTLSTLRLSEDKWRINLDG
jgi:tRNA(Ile2) C34 agmatinyltransferase TiaS